MMKLLVTILIIIVPSAFLRNEKNDIEIVAISKNISATPLDGAELLCVAISDSDIIWMKDGDEIDSVQYLTQEFTYNDVLYKMSFLRFCPFSEDNEGEYTCLIDDNVTQSVSLKMKEKYVEIQGTDNLTCIAYGFDTSVKYSWFKGSNPTPTVSSVSLDLQCPETGTYTCRVMEEDFHLSHSIEVTSPLEIKELSPATVVTSDQSVTLKCSGRSNRNRSCLNVVWTKNGGQPLESTQTMDGEGLEVTSSLTFNNITLDDLGTYTCNLTDGTCFVMSNTTLSIDESIEIIGLSDDFTAYVGNSVVLICVVRTMHEAVVPTITWTKDNVNLTQRARCNTLMTERTRTSYIQICNLTESDAGEFTCNASYMGFNTSNSLNLTIGPSDKVLSIEITEASIEGSVTELYLYEGDSASLTCTATGGPRTNMTLMWFKGTKMLEDTDKIENKNGIYVISSSYNISDVSKERDIGDYSCKVSSNGSSLEANISIDVGPNYGKVELAIVTSDAVSNVGLGVMFTCVGFVKKDSNISISWFNDNNEMVTTGGVFCVVERDFLQGSYKFMQSFLQIKGLMCNNAGAYTCSVSDGNECDEKNCANHTMNLYLRSSVEIVGTTDVVESKVGGEARLVCLASSPSNEEVSIIWRTSNNLVLSNGTDGIFQLSEFKVMGRRYFMSIFFRCHESKILTFADNSIFRCEARNGDNEDQNCVNTADIDLIVREEPQLFQIQFRLPSKDRCNKLENLVGMLSTRIKDALQSPNYCNCELTDETITDYKHNSMCSTDNPTVLIYRAKLSGTRSYSIVDLTKDLDNWVSGKPVVAVEGDLLQVNNNDERCSLLISSFNGTSCIIPYHASIKPSSLGPEIVGGIVLAAIFLLGIIAAIAMIFLLRHKAEKASISAVYNYVDAYQYQMYYGREGHYEELNDYECIDGSDSKYKYSKCDAYNKTYQELDDYNPYEPTNEGIYNIDSNVAYEKAKGEDIYDIRRCTAYTAGQSQETTTADGNKIYEKIHDSEDSNSETVLPHGSPKSFNAYEFIDSKSVSSVNYEEGAEITACQDEHDGGYAKIETTAL